KTKIRFKIYIILISYTKFTLKPLYKTVFHFRDKPQNEDLMQKFDIRSFFLNLQRFP
ncbi:hypothetical protein LEP1GSC116_1761, partial [Leptospira interrogans serovar Icterohaemorrhagiae str. Verdun HP]